VRDDVLVKIDDRMKIAPHAVSILRILSAPVFLFAFMWNFTEMAIFLYLIALASDIIDGRLAKRQKKTSSSSLEAYLDPIADFIFVLVAFSAFSLSQIYPIWILSVFALMFLFFIISSNRRRPLYDPVGKYYGIFLIVTIGVTLFFPIELVFNGVLVFIIAYTIVLVIYRAGFIWKKRKENEGPGFNKEKEKEQTAL
jgi:CDP-diacylglycerol--glycerol-3-phosphate 3-phosphatidyltransferase